ncbi:tetratricopeptide repeat protein [Streptomyces sp. A012304]|uniref:tetratricopeptide repeat protein n=1 Tax=Streptomyces sp. A012304 TaxID=375446 RepID=UPI00222E6A15|nr:tetratricopeptide repeat protein [Streptomyces sp. A012304]GKQ37867.1 hypothetical protein ALMP_44030 [Streptomyces sp. A012304]
MARSLFDEGAHEQAEKLIRQLLPDYEAAFGRYHVDSIGLRNLLGSALYEQRRLRESAAEHREAMERATRVLGADHRDTLGYAHNYGAALAVQGRAREAIAVLEDTLGRRSRTLGPGDLATLATAKALGATLYTAGATARGVAVLQKAYEASLGLPAGHPVREDIANNLRIARGW